MVCCIVLVMLYALPHPSQVTSPPQFVKVSTALTSTLTCTPQIVELIWITVDPMTCAPVPGMTGLAQHLVVQIMALRPRFSVALRKAIAGVWLPWCVSATRASLLLA